MVTLEIDPGFGCVGRTLDKQIVLLTAAFVVAVVAVLGYCLEVVYYNGVTLVHGMVQLSA